MQQTKKNGKAKLLASSTRVITETCIQKNQSADIFSSNGVK